MLARFFAWLDRALRTEPGAPGPGTPPAPAVPEASPARAPLPPSSSAHAPLALLSVDDGGQYLLVGAEQVTLGHLRAGQADLVFLADVGAQHAELRREDSLRDGPGWRVAALGGEPVTLNGQPLAPGGARLLSGARVRCGSNLEFLFRMPDPASASALLELQHGVECLGARRVLLVADGRAGRFRLGSGARQAVRVPGLEFVLTFEREGHELVLAVEAGAHPGELDAPRRVAYPPSERVCLSFGAARGSRPPFQCFLEPVQRPAPGR